MTLRLNGSTSGYVELDAPAVAGTTALTLPATTGTLATESYATTAGGLVNVANATLNTTSTVSFNNCFTSGFRSYRILVDLTGSGNLEIRMRLRASGTDATGSDYVRQIMYASGTSVGASRATEAYFAIGETITTMRTAMVIDLLAPQIAVPTNFYSYNQTGGNGATIQIYNSTHSLSTAYDGATFYTNTGTMTGNISIYGYKNS